MARRERALKRKMEMSSSGGGRGGAKKKMLAACGRAVTRGRALDARGERIALQRLEGLRYKDFADGVEEEEQRMWVQDGRYVAGVQL
jgi:sugar lactone lactonase YvrE